MYRPKPSCQRHGPSDFRLSAGPYSTASFEISLSHELFPLSSSCKQGCALDTWFSDEMVLMLPCFLIILHWILPGTLTGRYKFQMHNDSQLLWLLQHPSTPHNMKLNKHQQGSGVSPALLTQVSRSLFTEKPLENHPVHSRVDGEAGESWILLSRLIQEDSHAIAVQDPNGSLL